MAIPQLFEHEEVRVIHVRYLGTLCCEQIKKKHICPVNINLKNHTVAV